MSLEIQLGHPCPHLIIEDPANVSSDGTLATKAPVASADAVRVLANDRDYVPPAGLWSTARVVSSRRGPYRIVKCDAKTRVGSDGDLLTVTTTAGSATVTLPTGDAVTVERILRAIRLATGVVEAESADGALSLTDPGPSGPSSRVLVGGGATSALGFVQRGARGVEIIPPWELVAEPSVLPSEFPIGLLSVPARRPRFVRLPQGSPTFKATYTTPPAWCPRCGGTYVENDYRFDVQGDEILIGDENLLYQSCLKAILTRLGSNPYHPSYGSAITTRIGSKAISAIAVRIREDVTTALTTVQNLQREQARYQLVSDRERLAAVIGVQVTPHPSDPTVFRVEVAVRNGSNRPVSIDIVFSVPGAVALAGTNGLALGLEPTGLTVDQSRRFLAP